MNRNELMEKVRSQMPEKRWEHTLGVMNSAVRLARRYGADEGRAELAAILHDYAKYWPIDKQRKTIEEDGRALDLLNYEKALWHAEAGAIAAEKDLKVRDQEVLQAVRYHTSGRPNMTLLEKVVCLADYIEPGRDFPGVDDIREQAEKSLEEGLLAGFDHTLAFLMSKRKKIYPLTIMARNSLIEELENHKEGWV